jgi:hypothetical protein
MTAMAVNTAINIVATSTPQPSIKDIASYTVIILTPFLLGDEPTTLERADSIVQEDYSIFL